MPSDVGVCCGQVNRGVALANGRVFLGTLDAHLLALDAKTGHLLWDKTVADYKQGYSITVAPLICLADRSGSDGDRRALCEPIQHLRL